jgi:3-hydroxyisobutyrate dehydrogenase-like beta-hydroxyacid dehydrogenase
MAKVGFVGLGVMGSRMAEKLLAKGHAVTCYNRTRSKAEELLSQGVQWADTPREVGVAADVIFTSVSDGSALAAVTDGPDGVIAGLSGGKVLVDLSTVSPATSRAVTAKVRAAGADMLDAPVSGTVATLEQGKLSVMVGGRRETFDRVKPVLEDLTQGPVAGTGPKVTYLGENGMGLVMKIATNLNLAVQMLAFSYRFADGAISRTVCYAGTGQGLAQRKHDAEGHVARVGTGAPGGCSTAHNIGSQ